MKTKRIADGQYEVKTERGTFTIWAYRGETSTDWYIKIGTAEAYQAHNLNDYTGYCFDTKKAALEYL